MQTERVTYLTSAEHKAQLESFAKARGESVGHVVREATTRFMAQPAEAADEEFALRLLAKELNDAAPRMQATMERISQNIRDLRAENDVFFREQGIR